MEHNCTHEKEFAKLDIVYNLVMGENGNNGIHQTSIIIQESIKSMNSSIMTMNETVKLMGTAVSGFEKFQTETEAQIRENERHRNNKKWYVTTIIALGSGVFSLLILLIEKLI